MVASTPRNCRPLDLNVLALANVRNLLERLDELLGRNATAVVRVERCEHSHELLIREADQAVPQRVPELGGAERAAAVGVHLLKHSAEAEDAIRARS